MAKEAKKAAEGGEKKSRVTTGKGIEMEIKHAPDVVNEVMDETKVDGKVNVDAIKELAVANNIESKIEGKDYPNPGMWRMNVGNMLRGVVNRRGGLYDLNGKWRKDPNHGGEVTEEKDGTKIAKAKPKAEKADKKSG